MIRINKDLQTKLRKFRNDKRAYYSMLVLLVAFLVTLPAELLCNVRPILLVVDGKPHFPIFVTYTEQDFGGTRPVEPDYKSEAFMNWLRGEAPAEPETVSRSKPSKQPMEQGTQGLALSIDDFEEQDFDPELFRTLNEIRGTDSGAGLGLDDFEGDAGFGLGLDDFEEESGGSMNLDFGDFEEDSAPSPAVSQPKTKSKEVQSTPPQTREPHDVWAIWPPVRYDYKYIPTESRTGRVALAAPYEVQSADGSRILGSSWKDGHYLGTDDRGRDVLARLIYGFRISMIFGLSLAVTGTIIGCLLGGVQGFFGGWIDLIGQRMTEIWGSIPRLYILIILSAFLVPNTLLLFAILNLTAWMGIAAYIRAEFLKGRNLEYVKAARALGVSNPSIMRRHILPNSLTPVITFFPFEVTAGILALVSLDYLNLGVPSPAPSIGELLAQGKNNLQAIWILLPTFLLLTTTLTLLTFVGDGIRNAFDPRKAE
ncbi:putative ABC-type oligopeptide/dipeptide transport system, permease component (modular protein) [Nitrospina gracilis 3/211]|uniref:Putative ABC-type oligopeptide/dipeptide transport system, permease component (Modular protein) n=1 Tax=Nitrospina gracilis (strain 3/211) TaxID=1266370 RepID=M1Z1J8_NITG3|nr:MULTISPECIES: ABC transporter permease subunit [Nitrospina]MCF8724242.1 ABC-type microcin C transport system permease subunit YejE [Nitrospina sp. Nb-3]CCQ91390.1 putative ABC-type oligopeptide/dipeptide transport system, permease component (modular protein) [Nitrospina gracilis 3/211]